MCDECNTARLRFHHVFADCLGCRARAVARSPQFSKAWKEQRQPREYRELCEHIGVTHDQVVEAAKNDRACDALLGKVAA